MIHLEEIRIEKIEIRAHIAKIEITSALSEKNSDDIFLRIGDLRLRMPPSKLLEVKQKAEEWLFKTKK